MIDFIIKYWVEFLFGLIGSALFAMGKMIHDQREKYQCIGDGVEALLRNEIIESFNKYSDKGYCPIFAKENVTRMYTAYHALGGNDVATELKDKILAMPEHPVE